MRKALLATLAIFALVPAQAAQTSTPITPAPKEVHFKNIRQLTFGGENAEAYFSLDGKKISFQSTRAPYKCDQQFIMNTDGSDLKLASTGQGRTTCGYFTPDGQRLIYASTHTASPDCPAPPSQKEGYVWAIYPTFDIYSVKLDGSDLKQLTSSPGYDAEGTISPDGKKILFTSTRDGDLELYDMNLDGSSPRRLTNALGYDGGAWHSQDGQWIVWRANRPKTEAEVARYKDLFSRDMVMPSKMELFTMKADGTQQTQITNNGAANFAPYFMPDGKRIIFASNMTNPRGGNFDLFVINRDGTGLQQISFDESFDGFPMFSPDGKKIIWESNRNAAKQGETNIFIADWVE